MQHDRIVRRSSYARDEVVNHLESFGAAVDAPVRTVEGQSATSHDDGFTVRTSDGDRKTQALIMAIGAYQRAHRLPVASALHASPRFCPGSARTPSWPSRSPLTASVDSGSGLTPLDVEAR